MTQISALHVAQGALILGIELVGPALVVILAVGIVVSVFQAMTQINEATLSFVPKLVALGALLVILGPWMLQSAVAYTVTVLSHLSAAVG
ncbi:MAG: flagellar biosynthetic protein FliQ [Chloroflexota bacterium]